MFCDRTACELNVFCASHRELAQMGGINNLISSSHHPAAGVLIDFFCPTWFSEFVCAGHKRNSICIV